MNATITYFTDFHAPFVFILFSWRQYLEFLEKVYPAKTGLKIPESKKPLEFAKHYPEPSSDWPRVPLKMQDMEIDDPALREPSPQKQLEVLTGRIDKIQVCKLKCLHKVHPSLQINLKNRFAFVKNFFTTNTVTIFLFVGLHFILRNFKVRRSANKNKYKLNLAHKHTNLPSKEFLFLMSNVISKAKCKDTIILFVGLHHTSRNFKVR